MIFVQATSWVKKESEKLAQAGTTVLGYDVKFTSNISDCYKTVEPVENDENAIVATYITDCSEGKVSTDSVPSAINPLTSDNVESHEVIDERGHVDSTTAAEVGQEEL